MNSYSALICSKSLMQNFSSKPSFISLLLRNTARRTRHFCRRTFGSPESQNVNCNVNIDASKSTKDHTKLCSNNVEAEIDFTDILTQVKRTNVIGLPILHHYGYVSDLPPGHRFPMRKFHGVLKYLRQDNVISMKQVIEPACISEHTARLVHTAEYTHRFFTGTTTKDEQRRTGFVWDQGLLSRCRLEAGGTLLGCRLALERGIACSTGGGTHHAFPSFGSGFCLLNDMAIAAKYMTERNLVDNVLIVDLDVHQGDGTAHIFQDDDSVITFSAHAANNFPLKKQVSDIDLPLPDHIKDAEYMTELYSRLPGILNTVRPGLVIYDAGVDPHIKDDLGKLDLTDNGLYRRDLYVLDSVVGRGIPCMTVIGGGYSRDLEALSQRHTIVHRAATKVWAERLV